MGELRRWQNILAPLKSQAYVESYYLGIQDAKWGQSYAGVLGLDLLTPRPV